jgi:hypothetical protein
MVALSRRGADERLLRLGREAGVPAGAAGFDRLAP